MDFVFNNMISKNQQINTNIYIKNHDIFEETLSINAINFRDFNGRQLVR